MSSKFGLKLETIDSLNSIFAKYLQIERVILYGSRAKGSFKPGSDIDLTIKAPSFSVTELFMIEDEIDELLLPYKVDLSLLHQIENPDLLDHIQRVGIDFFKRS